jgi:hypothetical protein
MAEDGQKDFKYCEQVEALPITHNKRPMHFCTGHGFSR